MNKCLALPTQAVAAVDAVDGAASLAAKVAQCDEEVAIKAVMLQQFNQAEMIKIEREGDILSAFSSRHDNVLRLFFVHQDDIYAYFVTELCRCNLRNVLEKSNVPLDMGSIKYYAKQIGQGLAFVHGNAACHRLVYVSFCVLYAFSHSVVRPRVQFSIMYIELEYAAPPYIPTEYKFILFIVTIQH
jgi:hypothetical protein